TDGGHYENLGIESLLLRRCRLIIALDASEDGTYSFSDFTRLVRRMRMLHGIRIVPWEDSAAALRLDALVPSGGPITDVKASLTSATASNAEATNEESSN